MFSLLAAVGNFGGVVGPMTIGVVGDRVGLHAGMAALILAPLGCALAVMAGLRRRAA
jgi:fucose permease